MKNPKNENNGAELEKATAELIKAVSHYLGCVNDTSAKTSEILTGNAGSGSITIDICFPINIAVNTAAANNGQPINIAAFTKVEKRKGN